MEYEKGIPACWAEMENVEITVQTNLTTLLKMKGLNISHVLLPQILTTKVII